MQSRGVVKQWRRCSISPSNNIVMFRFQGISMWGNNMNKITIIFFMMLLQQEESLYFSGFFLMHFLKSVNALSFLMKKINYKFTSSPHRGWCTHSTSWRKQRRINEEKQLVLISPVSSVHPRLNHLMSQLWLTLVFHLIMKLCKILSHGQGKNWVLILH